VFLTGLPLSVVFTPFVYAVILVGGYAASAVSPRPVAAWQFVREMPIALITLSGIRTIASGATTTLTLQQGAMLATALILPGAVMLLLVWLGLRLVFRHAGVGGVLLALGARVPDLSDLEEHQLVNVVDEMAIAAGVPSPRVMLIDADAASGAANAAAVGWSIDDATIVVTKPLLDRLQRAETQAIIARLIAGVGNGDLKIALIILSVFQTVGVATLALNAVFGSQSRRTLWRLLRLSLTPRRARDRAGLESDVMSVLARGADANEDMSAYLSTHQGSGCLSVLQLPLVLGVGFPIFTSNFIVGMSTAIVTGPVIGAMWKRRELLADATAVQLTRNPDGLAAALERLSSMTVRLPRADSVSHLFAVWGKQIGLTPEQAAAYRQALREAGDSKLTPAEALTVLVAAGREDARARGEASQAAQADSPGSGVVVMSQYMHANLERRLAQLRSVGAHIDATQRPSITSIATDRAGARKRSKIGYLFIAVLVAVLGPLLGLAFALIMLLDIVFMTILLLMVWLVSHLAFVTAPHLWRELRHSR